MAIISLTYKTEVLIVQPCKSNFLPIISIQFNSIINFNFRYYETMKDPVTKNILIIGSMQEPVPWEFKVTLQPEDIGGVMKAVFNTSMKWFIIKNLPQYLIYLAKRKELRLEDIDSKVNNAYDQVMNNHSRRLNVS